MVSFLLHRLAALLGYLLYTLAVLVLLLWLLFPADSVKNWFEQELNRRYPASNWSIASLQLQIPRGLVLRGIKAVEPGAKKPWLKLSRLTLRPDPIRLLHRQPGTDYILRTAGGQVTGSIAWSEDWKTYSLDGNVSGVQLGKMEYFKQELQRNIDGTLSGNFTGKGNWQQFPTGEYQGSLQVEKGILHFRMPVLGLDQLAYNSLGADFTLREGNWEFSKGTLESSRMNGTFTGSLHYTMNLSTSRLQFKGHITPRSEMFAGTENRQLAEIIRPYLKGAGLEFTVNGTPAEPGILFPGPLTRALKGLSRGRKTP